MRQGLLQSAALAAAVLALGAYASPAAAFKTKLVYTFASNSGQAYCDGIILTTTDKQIYQGLHVNSDCDNTNDPAGGFVVQLPTEKAVEVVTGYASVYPNLSVVFYVNPTSGTWFMDLNTYDLSGINQWVEIDSGTLDKATPRAGRGGVSSLHARRAVTLDGPMARR